MTALIAAAILATAGAARLVGWMQRRRAAKARADAVIDQLLRQRLSPAARRCREVHGLTADQLLALADMEVDLASDADLRRRIEELTNQFPT